jgi:hypothetical protein
MMMTLSRRWVRGAVWVVLLMVGSVLARAQEVSGSISGTVEDAMGASVSGAVVTLTNTDRAFVERTLKTDKAGYYSASSLPLGNYSVTIAVKGFKTTTITGIVLHANDALKADQKLVAGSGTESVSVVASRAVLNLENGTSQGLVNHTQVLELPLVTRNNEQLVTLQPGVVYGGSGSDQLYIGQVLPTDTTHQTLMPDQALYSINGLRPTANSWTIDGADNLDHGGAASISGPNLTTLSSPSIDSISEFVTLRGDYEAQYGRSAGGQINVVTNSGTNTLHGGVFEFLRNDQFNANNYFNKLVGVARPLMRYNDFGATVGGPVVIPHLYNGKDKTFFFFSEELRRVSQYASSTAYVPTAGERVGDFTNTTYPNYVLINGAWTPGASAVCDSANAQTGACSSSAGIPYTTSIAAAQVAAQAATPPTNVISPAAQAYINDIYNNVPLPPSATDLQAGLDPHTLINNFHNVFDDTQEIARLDHALNSKTNIFYRFQHDDLPTTEGGGLFINGGLPAVPGRMGASITWTKSPVWEHLGHVTVAARPTLLFDMGYAYSSGAVVSTPVGLVSNAGAPDVSAIYTQPNVLPFPNRLGVVPNLTFVGTNGPNLASNGLYNDHNYNHNGFASVTKVMGQHTFKFGFTYNHLQKLENATGTNNQGNFSFNPGASPTAAQLTTLGTALGATVYAPSPFDAEWANFMIGNANGGFAQASQAITANLNENKIELYGQDEWRASPRLTVNLGVRYSYFAQPTDDGKELSNFDPAIFSTYNEQTIASNGNLCTLASQTTPGYSFGTNSVTVTYTMANCPNVNGLNAYQPNENADPLDGIILGDPDFIRAENSLVGTTSFPFTEPPGATVIEDHGSPFGEEVGQAEKHDWAPRLGFAYDVFGSGRTVLRGGYGMAYDDASVHQYEEEVFNNLPYVVVNNYSVSQMSTVSSTVAPNLAPPTLYATPVIYKTPYIQQYSLDVQQAVTPTLTLDVGYFGDHGTHLQGVVDINEVPPGAFTTTSIGYTQVAGCTGFTSRACEAPLNQIRPFPGYTAINTTQNIFNSVYNSLQAKVTKKFSGKSMIDANYTWSRSLTNAQNDYSTAPQNTYNLASEYGPSPYNRNSVLTVDGVWELPWMKEQQDIVGRIVGGWELTGIYTLDSGLPLTATMAGGGTVQYGGLTSIYNGQTNGGVASDAAGLGVFAGSLATLRPNQVLSPSNGYGQVSLKTRSNWFNQTAFAAPSIASFQVGNEKPGAIIGPGFNRLDVGIFRNFKITRGVVFTLRGEGFNVLNHTNWGSVDTVATDSQFGQVTSTRDPRLLQVAGKLNF